MLKLAGCCKPTPVAPLAGYVTSRGAVSVHRANCPVVRKPVAAGRVVRASWRLAADDAHGGVLNFALPAEAPPPAEVVRRLRRLGARVAGLSDETAGGVPTYAVYVRPATAAALKKAVGELRAAGARDVTYQLY